MEWAVQVEIYAGTARAQVLGDVLVHSLDIVDTVEPSCYTRLIGDERNWHICLIERGNCLRCTIDEVNAINRSDIPVIDDDCAVPVEQHSGAGTSCLVARERIGETPGLGRCRYVVLAWTR
jgi:hypothetical protein